MKYLIILGCIFFTQLHFRKILQQILLLRKQLILGKLEDAHFALQQAMQEIDIIIGKEVMALLPATMDKFSANTKDDNVMSNVGFMGSTIHRS